MIILEYDPEGYPMTDGSSLRLPELMKILIDASPDDEIHIRISSELAITAVRAAICQDKLPCDQVELHTRGIIIQFDEDGRTEADLPDPNMDLLSVLCGGNPRKNAEREEQRKELVRAREERFAAITTHIAYANMRALNG